RRDRVQAGHGPRGRDHPGPALLARALRRAQGLGVDGRGRRGRLGRGAAAGRGELPVDRAQTDGREDGRGGPARREAAREEREGGREEEDRQEGREDLARAPGMNPQGKLAILVGGGPAPGINSVIGAATIRSVLEGVPVLGIRDGFEWIMQGDIDHVTPLGIDDVSRIHFRGGSQIGISRANPTTDRRFLENAVLSLLRLDVSQLITIGGDDTAFSAMKLLEEARGRLRIVHVPKTIDNDLDLPAYVDTFGFQTARHVGVEIVKNLMVDAKTTSRWYFVTAMGRKAGHLALGIGKAAGATLTLLPEEFSGRRIRLKTVVDTLAGAIVKRLSHGR